MPNFDFNLNQLYKLFDGTDLRGTIFYPKVNNFIYDISRDGSILDGTSDSYNAGLIHFATEPWPYFQGIRGPFTPETTIASLEENGREIVIGPDNRDAFSITRKIYVPEDQGYARFLEIITNNEAIEKSYQFDIITGFTYDYTAVEGTGSGDTYISNDDSWMVVRNRHFQKPILSHVISGDDVENNNITKVDYVGYSYKIDLDPGETQIVMHFASQNVDVPSALAKAQSLESLGLNSLKGMSAEEIDAVVNFSIYPPEAVSDRYITDEDSRLTVDAPGVLENDINANGTALSATLVSGPNYGVVTLDANGSFIYTPNINFNGADSFSYKATNGAVESAAQTVILAVNPINDAPTLNADPISASVYEDASTTNLWNMIVGNGHDVEGDALTISNIDTMGTVGSVIFDKASKKLVYAADDNIQDLLQPGDMDLTEIGYTLSDGKGGTVTGVLNVDVKGVLEPNSAGLYIGTPKADVMQGSGAADKIIGAEGNDLMIGVGGDDWMNGADGLDTFLLGEGFGRDTIINFERGQDVIDAREFFGVSGHAEVFDLLDKNGDNAVNASDAGVSWAKGRMTVNFDADGANSLTLVGVQELKVTDFEHAFIA